MDIVDEKNDEPTVILWTPPEPTAVIRVGQVEIALPDDLAPKADLDDFLPVQPYKLVLFAEKAAVGHVVRPLAERYGIDLYLEAGEISDTHLHQMAEIGAQDGRPMVVFTLTDADPSGYWMPCPVAWKLHAFRDGWFPELDFEVQPIGFLPEQVRAINAEGDPLPASMLKEGEKRAGAWENTFGIQQVELDAVATLRPDVLERIVRAGIKPFFDSSLARRVRQAQATWRAEAQQRLEAQLGPELIAELRDGMEGQAGRAARPRRRDQRPALGAVRRHRPAGGARDPRPGGERHPVALGGVGDGLRRVPPGAQGARRVREGRPPMSDPTTGAEALRHALALAERYGLAVLPLHRQLEPGVCSCRKAGGCPHAGQAPEDPLGRPARGADRAQ